MPGWVSLAVALGKEASEAREMRLVAPLDGYRLVFVISRHVDVNTCALVESSTCARCRLVGSRRAQCALVSSKQALVSRCACLWLRGRRAAACPPGGLYRRQQQARAAASPPKGAAGGDHGEVSSTMHTGAAHQSSRRRDSCRHESPRRRTMPSSERL
ncbi:hypothetical protein T492DRAFT_1025222 [Pavlovales sp. CCMP2436]|nr:hypothetical protein T492DRAFT_1025222 [Pavlovales sp. CCMP2436]